MTAAAPAHEPGRIRTIAVGVDGSPNAHDAVQWALALAMDLGARVVAVHARGLLEHVGATPEVIEARFRQEWTAPLDVLGDRVVKRVDDGDPVTVLRHVAQRESVDLIVVGTRGLGDHPGLVLGSTSHQIAEDSRCPVMIVPPR
jgi:nucleotide-binding universal stress UspA family protein